MSDTKSKKLIARIGMVFGVVITGLGLADASFGVADSPIGWRGLIAIVGGLSLMAIAWQLWPQIFRREPIPPFEEFKFNYASFSEVAELFRIDQGAYKESDMVPLAT